MIGFVYYYVQSFGQVMMDFPNVKLILGPPRSGTSLLQRVICETPSVYGLYEPLRQELKTFGKLKYKPYEPFGSATLHDDMKRLPTKTFIVKEALGGKLPIRLENVLPDPDKTVPRLKPVFIFRHPLKTWQSIKARKWMSISSFIRLYTKNYQLFRRLQSAYPTHVFLVLHDHFVSNSATVLHALSQFWQVALNPVSTFKASYYEKVFYSKNQIKEAAEKPVHQTLFSHNSIKVLQNTHQDTSITDDEAKRINTELMPLWHRLLAMHPKPVGNHVAGTL
jgi:hypothetical protein